MIKFHLGNSMAYATCVAPLFYYSICLSVLRLCLLLKSLTFLIKKVFTCFSKTKARGNLILSELKVFTVDFFFAVNEIFFSIVLLFTLIYMNSLDEKSPNKGFI